MTSDTLADSPPAADNTLAYPDHWRTVPLGDVLVGISNGLTVKQDKSGIGYPVTRIETIAEDGLNISRVGYVSGISAADVERFRLRLGDILFSHINSEPQIGRTVLYEGEPTVLLHGMNLLRLRTLSDLLDSAYLDYVLKVYRSHGIFIGIASRAVGQASINQGKLKRVQIPLPPLPEQRAIARVLRAAQEAISARRREVTLERERKAALMQRLFTHGVRGEPTKQTEIGEMPESWQVVRLGDICSLSTGTTPATDNLAYYTGIVPFIKTSEIVNSRIGASSVHISDQAIADYNLKVFPRGTVLLAMYGQGKTRGQVAILDISATTTQNTAAIVPCDGVNAEYLWQWLMSQYDRLRDAGHQGHISHLNLGYVKLYQMPLPSISEQRAIADTLAACDTHIAALEREIALHEELFRALLEELMSGRISALGLVEGD